MSDGLRSRIGRLRRILSAAGLIAAVAATSAVAGSAEDVARYRAAAERGDRDAQFALGTIFDSSYGPHLIILDSPHHPEIESRFSGIARTYLAGRDVPKDDAEAFRWFRMAAEQGDPLAQVRVGEMYSVGRGTIRDEVAALDWYLKAADQGVERDPGHLGIKQEIRLSNSPLLMAGIAATFLFGMAASYLRSRSTGRFRNGAANPFKYVIGGAFVAISGSVALLQWTLPTTKMVISPIGVSCWDNVAVPWRYFADVEDAKGGNHWVLGQNPLSRRVEFSIRPEYIFVGRWTDYVRQHRSIQCDIGGLNMSSDEIMSLMHKYMNGN